jgi:histidine triad (HIT) family protein
MRDAEEARANGVKRSGFNPHTVFRKILDGELPAAFVYRDERVAAFMDIQPITAGHVLVVPLQDAATLAELHPDTGAHMFRIAQQIAAAIRKTDLKCEGINLVLADGVAAGQTVFHMHLHVFPRYADDGFRWQLPQRYFSPPAREQLDASCARIKAALAP